VQDVQHVGAFVPVEGRAVQRVQDSVPQDEGLHPEAQEVQREEEELRFQILDGAKKSGKGG
jgi:hypothetical protein